MATTPELMPGEKLKGNIISVCWDSNYLPQKVSSKPTGFTISLETFRIIKDREIILQYCIMKN